MAFKLPGSPLNFMGINPDHKGYCTPITLSGEPGNLKAISNLS